MHSEQTRDAVRHIYTLREGDEWKEQQEEKKYLEKKYKTNEKYAGNAVVHTSDWSENNVANSLVAA